MKRNTLLVLCLVLTICSNSQGFNVDAFFDLFDFLTNGEYELASNYEDCAKKGDKKCQSKLGFFYLNGSGLAEKDEKEAVFWFRKAAEQGEVEAQNMLGRCYYNGLGGLTKDYSKAVFWYKKAAQQGYSAAQHNLAICYMDGEGVARDLSKAVFWLKKEAEKDENDPNINGLLGRCYYIGDVGLKKDYCKALFFYKKVIKSKHANIIQIEEAKIMIKKVEEAGLCNSAETSNQSTTNSGTKPAAQNTPKQPQGVQYKTKELITEKDGFQWYKVSLDENKNYGALRKDGTVILQPKYGSIIFEGNGFVPLINQRGWGYYDRNGKEIIPAGSGYNSIIESNGFLFVFKNGKQGVFDLKGNEVIPLSRMYDKIFCRSFIHYDYRYFLVEKNGKKGVVNIKTHEEIIPISLGFDEIEELFSFFPDHKKKRSIFLKFQKME